MTYQNINQYNFKKYYLKLFNDITDLSLASDEKDYDEEVIFSTSVIANDDGNRMPIKMDFNSSGTSICIGCGNFENDVIVSENYRNISGLNLFTCTGETELCDVGLTGIDNGLVSGMTGQSIFINSGLYTSPTDIFSRYKYDKRFKMHPVTGFTTTQNRLLNDNSYSYTLTSKTDGDAVGTYLNLNGGFYQGFYKLQGFDYETMPERFNWGWTAEFLMRYRWTGNTEVGLNARYPDNKGTFFFMGARAENKFYHFANNTPELNFNGTWQFFIQDFRGGDSGTLDYAIITICGESGCTVFNSIQSGITIPQLAVASAYPITFEVTGVTTIKRIS
jgi:hypothetical protein